MNERSDTQLVNFWNDGDGTISWLDSLEEELKFRGYQTRSLDPNDGQERVGGERLKLEVSHPEIIKRREHTYWIAAKTQQGAEDRAEMFGNVTGSRWAGPGHYRSDVFIVEVEEGGFETHHKPGIIEQAIAEDAPVGPYPESETHGDEDALDPDSGLPSSLHKEIQDALGGDSNDAEHDALAAVAEHFGIQYRDPDELSYDPRKGDGPNILN